MNSRRRRQDRPIESLTLKIAFRAEGESAARIRELLPRAQVRGGVCTVELEAKEPAEMAEKAREVLEKLRPVMESSKGFK
ncbi:MAG TPA: hypothetical protein VEJ19_01995 [Nitrososphaerales archaeon]|nr:hypothetical protein [Nitrososphaerales archaeon]